MNLTTSTAAATDPGIITDANRLCWGRDAPSTQMDGPFIARLILSRFDLRHMPNDCGHRQVTIDVREQRAPAGHLPFDQGL